MGIFSATVEIAQPVDVVYNRWSRLDELAGTLPGVTEVRRIDDERTQWDVTVMKERRTFTAHTTVDRPGDRMAWASTSGTEHAGVVTFRALGEDRTRMTVEIDWVPGGLFDKVGDRLGLVRRQVERDLAAFRDHVEEGAVPQRRTWESNGGETGTRRRAGSERRDHGSMAARSRDKQDEIDLRDDRDTGTGGGDVDPARARNEDDRGRQADSPTEIPAKGWKDILKRTWVERKNDNVQILAAGSAFYLFLALFPALIATISVYGLVSDPADVQRQLEGALTGLPTEAAELIRTQLTNVADTDAGGLAVSTIISILAAIWSASKGMQALITSLNIAYNEDETRGFVKLRGLALLLTLGLIVAVAVGVGGMVLVSSLAENLGGAAETAVNIIRWPVLGLLAMAGLAALYRYAPDRENAEWKWVSPGAAGAIVIWLVASIGFSFYVNNFGNFNETYGSLAAVIILLLWLFLTAFIIVMAAEFDSEMERQTMKDSTENPDQALGNRDAQAADTVGASS
jgi:membrane protein